MEKFTTDTRYVPVEHDPFAGPSITHTVPTTEAQREVFAASLMGDDASCAYNESVSLRLEGHLNVGAITGAVQALAARHEGLRAVCDASGLRMIVMAETTIDVTFIDLADAGEGAETELKRLADEDMTKPFDLMNGPLFRASLVRLASDQHLLRLTGHHVICDGWSLGIIMADVAALYSARAQGTAPDLAEAVPFSAYALAQLEFQRSAEHAATEKFWLDAYKGTVPRMELPTDRPRPRQKTYKGNRVDLELRPELVRGLKEVAVRNGSSFVTTLLTTFETLLYKLTGDGDVVCGLPAAGQSDLGMKHLVGHCVNLLALRSRIADETPFNEHLRKRRTAVLDAFENQRYTFGTLVRKLNVPREPGRIPLVPVVFNIDMNMDDGVAFHGLSHRFISNPRRFENFELFLNATGNEERLVLEWSYNTDLFDASTVRGWMAELEIIIARVSKEPTVLIGQLIDIDAAQPDGPLPPNEWVGRSSGAQRSITALFDDTVRAHGNKTAVQLGSERFSYRDLAARADVFAAHLSSLGVKPGEPVGLCTDRSFDMVAAMIGILRAGGCFVPFDPAYPEDRLQYMLEDTQVRVLFTQRHLRDQLPGKGASILVMEDLTGSAAAAATVAVSADDAAYIMYTSGSTGKPKGVVVPHRAVSRLVRDQNFLPFGPHQVFLQLSNISFDASTLEIWGALLNGGKLVLQPQQKPTLTEVTECIKEHNITAVWFTAGLFNLLVDDHLDGLRGLKHILTGGDVLSVPHVKRALKVLGPGVLINGYGPTENTTFTCCHAIDDEKAIGNSVPIGKPINETRVHVLNDAMQPVAIGQKGELYAGGEGVALGYWNKPELTVEKFVHDPFGDGNNAKLYRTGDIVRWLPDGTIEFIGRADGQVKVRGFRIELGEIEAAMDGHAQVKDRVVICRTDMPGEKQLVAYIVPQGGPDLLSDNMAQEKLLAELREQLHDRLPEHMLPSAFVVMPELPLNPNGKVDKKALPAPTFRTQTMRAQHVAPRDHVERMLADVWNELLGVENIGVHDNFFDLGGHSLIGIQLLAKVEQQHGKGMSLKALFQAPTIAGMAKLLQDGGTTVPWTNLSAIQPNGNAIPFFCVHGDEANHFLPRYLGNDQPFYAFFHQGEDGKPIRFTKVPDIASHFINELRTVRPNGPYLLGGYSFGGIVAYEMAQQLRKSGEEVALLALFDTYDPMEFMKVMQQEAKPWDGIRKAFMRRAVRFYQRQGKLLPPKLRHFYIIDTYDEAIRDYRAQPYDGTITIFKAKDSIGAQDMGWKQWSKHVDIRNVPGDHYSMIKEPDVRALSAELGSAIDLVVSKRAVEAV
ncbi:MAG: amino acid adenylation domain-containing protein [Flavobacteriales bacterium]|nr:MAG: amino acid adenylation domain-containing protein [Flavobacteriales bacterium]